MDKKLQQTDGSVSIDHKIAALGGWRAEMLGHIRELIKAAIPEVVEECKWVKPTNPSGVPVWSSQGILCTGESYKAKLKLTFANGASLADPHKLFNAGLEGKQRRAIDITQGQSLDETAFKALISAAADFNHNKALKQSKR